MQKRNSKLTAEIGFGIDMFLVEVLENQLEVVCVNFWQD